MAIVSNDWSYRRTGWFIAAPVTISLLSVGLGISARSGSTGFGVWTRLAVVFAPMVLAIFLLLPRLDRERAELIARGYSESEARNRVGRNAKWRLGPLLVLFGVWIELNWAVSMFLVPGSLFRTVVQTAGMWAIILFTAGAFICGLAWRSGRIVGHGEHCNRCGYPVPPMGIPLCPECGRIFAFGSDVADGRVVRRAWMLVLALLSALAALALGIGSSSGRVQAFIISRTPTASLIAAAVGPDLSGAKTAWAELGKRTLSQQDRAHFLDSVMTAWESHGVRNQPSAVEMQRLVAEELLAGNITNQAMDRLIAFGPALRERPLHPAIVSAILANVSTPAQFDLVAVQAISAIEESSSTNFYLHAQADWLVRAVADGSLSEERSHESVDVFCRQAESLGVFPGGASRVVEIICRTDDENLRDYALRALLQIPGFSRKDLAISNSRLLLAAYFDGRISDEQMGRVIDQTDSLMFWLGWGGFDESQRQRVARLFLALGEDGHARVRGDQAMLHPLLAERRAGRLTEEQAAIIDKVVAELQSAQDAKR